MGCPILVGYPLGVSTLFSRKSSDSDAASKATPTAMPTIAGAKSKRYTPSKKELGKATPKRRPYGRTADAPPANRREALKKAREKQREARLEARAGMMAGKEEHMLPRDKGPERRLVRDIVDSRRNAGSLFLPVALISVVGMYGTMPAAIRVAGQLLWFALVIAIVIDSFLMTRKIKKLLPERLPKSSTLPRKHYLYAVFRSLSLRRMRIPAPMVKVGDQI